MKLPSAISIGLWACLLVAGFVAAAPAPSPAVCKNNLAYNVLAGPLLKDIAKDFCTFYLKNSGTTTTTTVKAVTTVTKGSPVPTRIVKATAITQETAQTTITVTATLPGETIAETVTQTVTAEAMMKRAVWTPPKGAGPDYVLPQLILFPANVIKQACECLVTPPVNTVTKTATATATVSADTKTPTVTKTVATKTNTVTMTATNVATTTANPTTTTRTETVTTTNMPVPTSVNCENRAVPQTRVRGSINSDPISFTVSEQSAASAEDCFSICRTQQPQAVSFAFAQFNTVGCFCYNSMICNIVTPAPNGNLVGGDLAVQFMQG